MKPLTPRTVQEPRVVFRPGTATRVWARMASPIGDLLLLGDGEALTGLSLPSHRQAAGPMPGWTHDVGPFRPAMGQLQAYFAGERSAFDLVLAVPGTAFQRAVWQALIDIPFGQTDTYGAIARRIGCPGGARAVGLANARNPIAIIVPCHRVIGRDGSLTGYAGGIERKRWLLAHESQTRAATARLADPAPYAPPAPPVRERV